ncbi:MAG: malate dehydrogenase [Candidatus Bathyarchaeota archaeon]|nr:MAG: malate dehydrogenase [Candidatus Bathyarchaeota archaeon]
MKDVFLIGGHVKISIIGAGKVGSSAAFNIIRYGLCDVILIDIIEDLAKGQALDMLHASSALAFDNRIIGTSDYSEMEGSEVVVIVAGSGRKPGMTRFDLLTMNSKIMQSVILRVKRYAPDCKLLVVTNPVDIMTYIAYRESGFERNRVLGMGNILDIHRFKSYLAENLNLSGEDIQSLVIGEHGDSMVPLINYTTISGVPITSFLENSTLADIVHQTRTSGSRVIRLKQATTYAPGTVIAVLVDAILRGRNRVTSVSTPVEGEYGLSDLCIGVPAVIGTNGVEKIIELDLAPDVRAQFDHSASVIQKILYSFLQRS